MPLQLFRSKDKLLRAMLMSHIVSDIRNMNRHHRNDKVNKSIQAFMYTMLADEDATAAKKSLDVMITLYKKKVRWLARVLVVRWWHAAWVGGFMFMVRGRGWGGG